MNLPPFSRFGSFLVVSACEEDGFTHLYIRDVRGGDLESGRIMEICSIGSSHADGEMWHGASTATLLELRSPSTSLGIIMPDENSIRMRSQGAGFVLRNISNTKYDTICSLGQNRWELCSYSREIRMLCAVFTGDVRIEAPWESIGNTSITIQCEGERENGYCELLLENYKVVPQNRHLPDSTFEEASQTVREGFEAWDSKIDDSHEDFREARNAASCITWANFVKPEGLIRYPAMYMSKNEMTNIWSWDNCFSSIFLARDHPELAFGQFMMFVHAQDASGMYPDYLNNRYASYACTKPPVYGWCYDCLLERNPYFHDTNRLVQVHTTLALQTEFWLKHRILDSGLPCYTHGNDSGWDNGTNFALGVPVCSPDLSAFLVYQMDFLSRICTILGRKVEAKNWKGRADELMERCMKHLWKEEGFQALYRGQAVDVGDSLQLFLPIIVAYRMKRENRDVLLSALRDRQRFRGEYGLATEAFSSPLYTRGGYWRGPVWAPVTLIFVDSLRRMDYADSGSMAEDLAESFVRAVCQGGMAENFDAHGAEGFDDTGFAWTASVFLVLLRDYLREKQAGSTVVADE